MRDLWSKGESLIFTCFLYIKKQFKAGMIGSKVMGMYSDGLHLGGFFPVVGFNRGGSATNRGTLSSFLVHEIWNFSTSLALA